MPITIPRETLSRLVNASADVACTMPGTPVTELASLSVSDGVLTIQATDMENWLRVSAPVDGDMAACQVNAAKLKESISLMRGDTFRLTVEDGFLHLSAKGKRKIATQIQPYPEMELPAGVVVNVNAESLKDAIAFTSANMCMEEAKVHIAGLYLHSRDGQLKAATHSGNSCSWMDVQPCRDEVAASFQRSTVALMKGLDGPVRITFGERMVALQWDGGELISKRIEAQFAPYDKPWHSHDDFLSIRQEEMLDRVRAIGAVAAGKGKSRRVTLHLGPVVELHGASNDSGTEGRDDLDAEWSGSPTSVAFDTGYMSNSLAGFGPCELRVGIRAVEFDGGGNAIAKVITIVDPKRPERFAYCMPLRAAN